MKQLAITMCAVFALLSTDLASAQSLTLPEGMGIRLQTRQDISSKNAKVGDPVEFTVAEPVNIAGTTAIPAGSPATGEVTRVQDNGLLGRSGKLEVKVTKVRVGETDVPVRGQRNVKGKSGTLGAVGAGVVFLPLAVIVRGREAKIRAGTTFEVFVDQDVALGDAKPVLGTADPAVSDSPALADPYPHQQPPKPLRTIDPSAPLG
ncbi:hypothetical protein [Rhizorhapis suberifaciens]|uniref:Uncharacterized protein n=1 Tax=Rhizorhapis suberifaciens TaxID=13656 RepID=A0A840HTT6_9SPHN|nr:hypothetical protein [Rhizorhapis suberifaciens]MBB4641010.1 hypothetical protein [Rhizorhapis suberifaciens]